jgi:hypothetical protein
MVKGENNMTHELSTEIKALEKTTKILKTVDDFLDFVNYIKSNQWKISIHRSINEDTFQPMLLVIVYENNKVSFYDTPKFKYPMELALDFKSKYPDINTDVENRYWDKPE